MSRDSNLQPAVVLHSRPYREHSLIIDWLTPGAGRVATVYKGARQRRRSAPHPFSSYQIRWSGRSNLATLVDVESQKHRWLMGDAAVVGLYANELLIRLLAERDAHPRLFHAYVELIDLLTVAAKGAGVEQALRRFERVLLAEIGYGLELDRDAHSGEPVCAERRYAFDPEIGFTACAGGGSTEAQSFAGRVLLALAADDVLAGADRRDAKRLMRAALAPHLAGRPLRAMELWQPSSRVEQVLGPSPANSHGSSADDLTDQNEE